MECFYILIIIFALLKNYTIFANRLIIMNVLLDDNLVYSVNSEKQPDASGAFGLLYNHGFYILWKPKVNVAIEITAIKEALSAIHKLSHHKKVSIIIDLSQPDVSINFTPSARALLLGNDFVRLCNGIACITTPITRKSIFLHLVALNKLNVSLKAFESEQSAVQWVANLQLN